MTYVELPSDAAFDAFLASLTPGKVLRDRTAMFTKVERQRTRYLTEKDRTERDAIRKSETYLALQMAAQMRVTEKGTK